MSAHDTLPLLIDKLLRAKRMLVTAESCTGGLLSALLTETPGSSRWFWGGFITYSNAAKEQLGVPKNILQTYGAVSEHAVAHMARSAIAKVQQSATAIAISGIAGPDGGSKDKPVGTVCIAWHVDTISSATCCFDGNRQQIREQALQQAICQLDRLLQSCLNRDSART